MQKRKALTLVAIPFQFAAAHALGYGVASRVFIPGSVQVVTILLGNTIGITVIGLLTERLLDVRQTQRGWRVTATAVACISGIVIVSQLTTNRYEALAVPIALGVMAFHISAFRTA